MNEPITLTGCDAVNEHISKPIPDTLWHYTSFAGFQGIISSKKIWASEYRFLNDRKEFVHAKELAQALVNEEPERIEQFPVRKTMQDAFNMAFNTGLLHEDRNRIMVASFSEEADQLSQWRGYADNSRGVSVGFDLRGIRPPSDIGTAVIFAPCLYKQSDKCKLLKSVFAQYRKSMQDWWDSKIDKAKELKGRAIEPQTINPIINNNELGIIIRNCSARLQFDLIRIALLLKDEGFCEEKEWRLVLPQEAIKLPSKYPIEFRPTRDTLVPYIAYPLNLPNEDGPIFCKDLILGSGTHPSSEMSINLFLRRHEITTPTRLSEIPYRPT
jgi:hypothetical protein